MLGRDARRVEKCPALVRNPTRPGMHREDNIELSFAVAVGTQATGDAVAVEHFAHEYQTDALATFLGGEERREQMLRAGLIDPVA